MHYTCSSRNIRLCISQKKGPTRQLSGSVIGVKERQNIKCTLKTDKHIEEKPVELLLSDMQRLERDVLLVSEP